MVHRAGSSAAVCRGLGPPPGRPTSPHRLAGVKPPRAPQFPVVTTRHGHERVDEFAWMADREDPRLTAYLQDENAYADHRTAHLQALRTEIFDEIRSRTVETDLSVPVRYREWWYYSGTVEGHGYAVHARLSVALSPHRPTLVAGEPPEGEQVLLDENLEAIGSDFFALGDLELSPDGRLLAFSSDRSGQERYDLVIRELQTGAEVDALVHGIGEGLAWSADSRHVFYTRLDRSWRSHEIWRHEVGTPASADVCVLAEPDERMFLGVSTSKDERWILLTASSKTSTGVWLVDAAVPTQAPVPVVPRRDGVLADVEPYAGGLLITHNAARANFQVSWAPLPGGLDSHEWVDLDWSAPDELIQGVEAFDTFVSLSLRSGGRPGLRIVPITADGGFGGPGGFGPAHDVAVAGETVVVATGVTPDPTSTTVQVVLESLAAPPAVYDYDVVAQSFTLLKSRRVRGYDLTRLRERRLWATAPDGARIPISLVWRADVEPDGTAPGLLSGYGAYGIPSDPAFSVARLSLLDRGVVVAIAHVRGGTELGWDWYEAGRLADKPNSFTDFLACAQHLGESGWVDPRRLAAEGGSAGGLLVAASLQRDPARFRVVHAQVPFVDVLTSMLDLDLPLTVTEQEEWGDPVGDPTAYALIRSYSPYENVTADDYPALLVTTSWHDTRVLVTEPAKWVARLRDRVTDDEVCRPIVFRTEMDAGHGGRSGRYDMWREIAWEWSFLLDQLGCATR